MRKLLLVGVIGVIVVITLSIGVYKLTKKDERFKTMEKIVQGEKHTLKYYMYEKSEEIKLISLDQTKRDTAKDNLISNFSYLIQSDNRNRIMDHSLECKRTTDVINEIGWEEYLRWSRTYYNKRKAEIIGEALYRDYVINIVRFTPKQNDETSGETTGYFFKKIGNKYYSDNDPGAEDLFLQALDGYEWDMEKIKDLKEEDM